MRQKWKKDRSEWNYRRRQQDQQEGGDQARTKHKPSTNQRRMTEDGIVMMTIMKFIIGWQGYQTTGMY